MEITEQLANLEALDMLPPYQSLRSAPHFKTNPYKPERIQDRTRKVQGKAYEEITTSTGEVRLMHEVDKIVSGKRDELPYIKVFKPQLLNMGELSVPGLKLLCYIMHNLKVNAQEISINVEEYMDQAGYSGTKNQKQQRNRVQYYKGVLELLNQGYIARKRGSESTFFINVNRFFNGDRISLESTEKEC